MRRRDFITFLGYAAAAWPRTAQAQQEMKPTIGWLDIRRTRPRDNFDAFRRGLAEVGFLEGRDVIVEYHTADPERLSALATDLVRRRLAAIFASTGVSALAA